MSTLKVINDPISTTFEELPLCFTEFISNFKSDFEKMNLEEAIKTRSNSFRESLKEKTKHIKNLSWESKLRDGTAAFQLDAKYICAGRCNSSHQVNIVICLNNREAIGTNFLKLEIAALSNLRTSKIDDFTDENILGILISLDSDLLSAGGWDNSYADSSEYSAAFRKYYKNLIKSNIVQLRIHKV
jgi:hypothetical protein